MVDPLEWGMLDPPHKKVSGISSSWRAGGVMAILAGLAGCGLVLMLIVMFASAWIAYA